MRIVLYQPEIPQNTCGIIRNCACLGLDLEIIYPIGFIFSTSSPSSEIKRIMMDYSCKIISHNSWEDFLKTVEKNERTILFTPHSSLTTINFTFLHNDVLIFGRESTGVDMNVFSSVDISLSIPMNKKLRSFNLMASVSIILGKIF
jgi:tRNA (cytidine/uridine-2'-O-)-methyltransferase